MTPEESLLSRGVAGFLYRRQPTARRSEAESSCHGEELYAATAGENGVIMGKKKKDTIELRFYEIPQNEYVLALLGENWIRDYGHDEVHLHFHNLMEIGVCRNGTGN